MTKLFLYSTFNIQLSISFPTNKSVFLQFCIQYFAEQHDFLITWALKIGLQRRTLRKLKYFKNNFENKKLRDELSQLSDLKSWIHFKCTIF